MQTLLIVLAIVAVVGIALSFVMPYLKKRGVDLDKILGQTKDALAAVSGAYETVKPFLSEIQGIDKFERIQEVAHIAVANAQQLNDAGKLSGEDRKTAARQYVIDSAKLLNIAVTPEVERLIDGAIEADVFERKHPQAT